MGSVVSAPAESTPQQLHDRTHQGQQELRDTIAASADPNDPSVDPLRTRLYSARMAELELEGQGGADRASNFVQALAQTSEPDGGFTIDPRTGAAEQAGFFVSVHPEHEVAVPVGSLDMSVMAAYEQQKGEVLGQEGNFFGAWHDPETGIVSLDVSSKAQSAEEARRLAAAHGQVAFFDAQTFDSVEVDASQRDRIENIVEGSQ